MVVEVLHLSGVRHLEATDVALDGSCNIIVGANGAGKTSVLEGIHVLGRARSFRTPYLDRVRRNGEGELLVRGTVTEQAGQHRLGVARDQQGTRVRIDGRDVRGLSELAWLLPVQVINTDSPRLLQDGPSARRRFLNWTAFHVEHDYQRVWRRFDRALKQRNMALREGQFRQVRALEPELAAASDEVDGARMRIMGLLEPLIQAYLSGWLPDVPVELRYRRGWKRDRALREVMDEQRTSDLNLGYTQSGPQRGDLQIRTGGMEAQHRLSRGQQKLVVIAVLLAQLDVIGSGPGPDPILLVDDLAAELDAEHRQEVVDAIFAGRWQTVFTAIENDSLPQNDCRLFHVELGRLREMI